MTIAHKTKLSALIVALMVAAATLLVPSTAADAGNGAFALVGTAHLSDGIGSNQDAEGCLGGYAVGAHLHPDILDVAAPAGSENAFAGFTYNNPDTVAGDAEGNLKIEVTHIPGLASETIEVGFVWERTVGVATIELIKKDDGTHVGDAIAAFAPVDVPLFSCNGKSTKNYAHGLWPNDEHAQVVGVGVVSENA